MQLLFDSHLNFTGRLVICFGCERILNFCGFFLFSFFADLINCWALIFLGSSAQLSGF